MLAVGLHVKQLLRFSIVGEGGHAILSFSKAGGRGFLSKQRETEICKRTLSENTKDSLTLASQFPAGGEGGGRICERLHVL